MIIYFIIYLFIDINLNENKIEYKLYFLYLMYILNYTYMIS